MENTAEVPTIVYVMGEFAVALIGFTGLISVLRQSDGQLWSEVQLLRLRTLIEPALFGVFASLLPATINLLTTNQNIIWPVSNGIFVMFGLYALWAFVQRAQSTHTTITQRILAALTVVVLFAMIGGASGLVPNASFTFLLGLWVAIIVATYNFTLLLFDPSFQRNSSGGVGDQPSLGSLIPSPEQT